MSEIDGRVMDYSHKGDDDLSDVLSRGETDADLIGAQPFVEQVETRLKKEGWG